MLCHHLPDASSDVRVVGQGRGSENREGGYFYHGVFQLDLFPDLHTRERLPACSHERDTQIFLLTHLLYCNVCRVPVVPKMWLLWLTSCHLAYLLTLVHSLY